MPGSYKVYGGSHTPESNNTQWATPQEIHMLTQERRSAGAQESGRGRGRRLRLKLRHVAKAPAEVAARGKPCTSWRSALALACQERPLEPVLRGLIGVSFALRSCAPALQQKCIRECWSAWAHWGDSSVSASRPAAAVAAAAATAAGAAAAAATAARSQRTCAWRTTGMHGGLQACVIRCEGCRRAAHDRSVAHFGALDPFRDAILCPAAYEGLRTGIHFVRRTKSKSRDCARARNATPVYSL